MKSVVLSVVLFVCTLQVQSQTVTKRNLLPADFYRLQNINDPQVSPDGLWVAYVLSSIDTTKDRTNTDIWMVSWDGKQNVQLTNSSDAESDPRWSPDGKYLSFVSARYGNENAQLWLLDRRGGEAQKITELKADLNDYAWSPDSKKILLVLKDPDYSDTAKTKVKLPYVIDRYHFKQDYQGYLGNRKNHLYLFTVATHIIDTLTRGNYNETDPAFSPDGRQIAFVSNRSPDPDRNDNTDIFVMDAVANAIPKQLTTWPGADAEPRWSPDGKNIAYLQSSSSQNFTMYGHNYAAVIPAAGGMPKLLSVAIDRPVKNLRWAKESNALFALLEDDRQCYPVQLDIANNTLTKLAGGDRSFSEIKYNSFNNNWLAAISEPQLPTELYSLENGRLRRLTYSADSFLAPLKLPVVQGFRSKSKDGNTVSNILYLPADSVNAKALPLILFIHGGPVAQDEYEFDFTRLVYAAAGYAVAGVNYRGSSGRGVEYIKAIYGDWGNKEELDIIGAADELVAKGIVDVNRMGIAGWSYGGISTDYTIATDQRFKAAVSGAGSALQLSLYGVDQYITQYETELGVPWKNSEKWIKLSYPFFHADKIKTPTLFMASEKDFNVPTVGAEQMYQALKSLGIPTGLVIYPGQNHGIVIPSYRKDRFERHLQWFNKYLK